GTGDGHPGATGVAGWVPTPAPSWLRMIVGGRVGPCKTAACGLAASGELRTLLLPLVPVNADVVRLPPHGDDVDATIPVQVRRRQVLDRHAAVLDNLPLPLAVLDVGRLVDAHSAPLSRLLAQVAVTHADDQLLVAVAVDVGAPDRMTPAQPVIDDMAVPQCL